MLQTYDVVLIGSGPAAVAALAALPSEAKIAVVTGESAQAPDVTQSKIHSKIRAVAKARGEFPGLDRPLPFFSFRTKLFDTAIAGGLANYWGQQFLRYEKNDPWPRDVFSSYFDYLEACRHVEALFVCSPGIIEDTSHHLDGRHTTRMPNIIIGTPDAPDCGLLAMRLAFNDLCAKKKVTLLHGVALRLSVKNEDVTTHLTNGDKLTGRTTIVAAGAVGSLRIAMASCSDIKAVALKDHAPYMLYTAGLRRHINLVRSDGIEHFNGLTIERNNGDRIQLFASLYRMSQSSLGLLLAALGLPVAFPTVHPPHIVDWITPVQVWTEKTYMRYCITKGINQVRLAEFASPQDDEDFQDFRDWLKGSGAVLKLSRTLPGEGFHYHAGEVSLDGMTYIPLRPYFEARFEGCVRCVDASSMTKIGCRPHTLTSMATAWRLSTSIE